MNRKGCAKADVKRIQRPFIVIRGHRHIGGSHQKTLAQAAFSPVVLHLLTPFSPHTSSAEHDAALAPSALRLDSESSLVSGGMLILMVRVGRPSKTVLEQCSNPAGRWRRRGRPAAHAGRQ